MEEVIIQFILVALENALQNAIEDGIQYIVRKVVDNTGRCVSEIVYQYDSDGDGENDAEEVLYTIDTLIPDMSNGYCLCNKGDVIGLGYPQYQLVSGIDFAEHWDLFVPDNDIITFTGNSNGYLVDYDFDGEIDDVLIPFDWDYDGDGRNDWGWLLDTNGDNLPDVSPDSPFYPIGSPEYQEIIHSYSDTNDLIMSKPLDMYTVTEGLLLLSLLCNCFFVIKSLFTRKDVFRYGLK